MKTEFNFENAKVGDKVYHVVWGWTEIKEKNEKELKSEFDYFMYNGKKYHDDLNPAHYPYNPFEQNQERVVDVKHSYNTEWKRRVLIKESRGMAICWGISESLDKIEKSNGVFAWEQWREIEPQKELTQEEKINILWEKYGKEL